MAAILIGSKFVLSFFGASGDFWGNIAEYRHVYSAIEGIQCTISVRNPPQKLNSAFYIRLFKTL